MKEQKSSYEPDLAKQRRFYTGDKHVKQGIRSIVYLPLISGGKAIGALTIASRYPHAYSLRQVNLLEQLASYITAPIENSQLYSQAKEKARIDELTGLFNRRHFDERLKEEITRHARYGGTFSILMLDLDSFKVYNDIFGHPAGDQLLTKVGDVTKLSIRTSDQAFRYGGDEFAIILPHIDTDSAFRVSERVRQSIAREMQASSSGVTASIGVANCPADGVTPADLVIVADTALYYAKYNGGNRTHLPTKVLAAPPPEGARETRSPSLAAIYALTTAVDAKDHYTYTHSHQVRGYALALAEAVGSPPDAMSMLSAAALLHDIGKIGVHDHILTKKGPLTPEETQEIRNHPRLGVSIIGNVPGLASCVPALLYHHENYDGSGYPEGLKGEAIPFEARILAIANAFADMTSDRPHRASMSWNEALEEIKRNAGTQFDPALARSFVDAVRSGVIAGPAGPETSEEIYVPVTNAAAPDDGDHGTHNE
jgi:diguanylate cyclase (GGDEF)-like protein/putative nucleotidyltransferase with HDIG domain